LELWKEIPGYEGLYWLSNHGRVKNRHGRFIAPDIGSYKRINLSKMGICKRFSIHVIVCLVFNGPKPTPTHEVNHKDGQKWNNRFDNLEWVTRSQNSIHAVSTGLKKMPKGGRMKSYFATSPNGETSIITGLRAFCRQHKFIPLSAAGSKTVYHRGWKIEQLRERHL
jgi:hypothetical protein